MKMSVFNMDLLTHGDVKYMSEGGLASLYSMDFDVKSLWTVCHKNHRKNNFFFCLATHF